MSTPPVYIFREKRMYNKWAASQTLEDYALRYTADSARRWSAARVANTAIGASAFLACEAIGGAITYAYGFENSVAAILASMVLMFLIGFPIAYHAAREGLDIDLLTRGAGFGYLGSTLTSLIYASFTFLLFSVEASIMSVALRAMTGIPLSIAYIISSLCIIPIALYGMSAITRFQNLTQPIWVVFQVAPIAYILWIGGPALSDWQAMKGTLGAAASGPSLLHFGLAFSTLLSLLPQIGEQADYLRFLPAREKIGAGKWWAAMLISGPGWTLIGGIKLLLGSCLVAYALHHHVPAASATNPMDMFLAIFRDMSGNSSVALVVTGIFVIVCQLKINVTNAYAGSIAWSNFFSRLTHNHPGRVVWLVFNVLLALLLMEVGIFNIMEDILLLYAILAAGWIGALAADLVISKPLNLSPKGIEFKRAHLFDVNPVGVGAMLLSIIVAGLAHAGAFGQLPRAFAPVIGLAVAFVAAPAIALLTHGRFYIARTSLLPDNVEQVKCTICENSFQPKDTAYCPVYSGSICSLCCTLESRCHDRCKEDSRITEQVPQLLKKILPEPLSSLVHTTVGQFLQVLLLFTLVNAAVLELVYWEYTTVVPEAGRYVRDTLWILFFGLFLLSGVAAWIVVLAHNSRRSAVKETAYHMDRLIEEIAAHEATDAELQKAKEVAETANAAKSRYLASVSHEIRSPLNSIYGYAQLLERGADVAPAQAGKVIRRSSEHLTNLVEGLLDISQVENGILRLSRDTIRFPSFLTQIVNMFEPQASASRLSFVFDRPAQLPEFVRTDQKRLRQILINLLSNAIKFTEEGEVRFRVRYRSELAIFEISDSGIGIEPADIDRIFAPFERGGSPGANERNGVGLGLSITNALVHIMGGEITVKSQPGQGTRFVVKLMMSQPPAHPLQTRDNDVVTGYEGHRRTVLLIDDDPAQLAVLHNLLQPLGFTVRSAQDGERGIALAEQIQPDIVLLDISMPGLSGWETARILRKNRGPALRIAMVSADAYQPAQKSDGPDIHDTFLMKPVELNMLLDVVSDLLGLRWTTQDINAPDEEPVDPQPSKERPIATGLPDQILPYLSEIEKLARIGHVSAIVAQLDAMEDAVPESVTISREMREFLQVFDLKTLADIARNSRSHVR